jgi:hypothetical protein
VLVIDICAGFQDPSALLKHELAYCLGQMKNTAALSTLQSVLADEREDPMVRHEVSSRSSVIACRLCAASCFIYIYAGGRGDGCYIFDFVSSRAQKVSERLESLSA